jgi:hypothetical protein
MRVTAPLRALGVPAAAALLGACAHRGVESGPPSGTGAGTWAVVVTAALAATVVIAALIALPAQRPGGSVFGSWVLALQAGGVTVAAAIVVGAAVRSEQLLGRPAEAEQAASLLRLSSLDGGDTGFFALIVLVTAGVGALLVTLFVLGARFAGDADPLERWFATGLLGLEVLGSVTCLAFVVSGFRHAGFVLPALALPVLVVATVAVRPRG